MTTRTFTSPSAVALDEMQRCFGGVSVVSPVLQMIVYEYGVRVNTEANRNGLAHQRPSMAHEGRAASQLD